MLMYGILITVNIVVFILAAIVIYRKIDFNAKFNHVENKTKKFNEDDSYFQLVHDEHCYLFTDTEVDRASKRAQREECGER